MSSWFYYQVFPKVFTPEACQQIIGTVGPFTPPKMELIQQPDGKVARHTDLFWVYDPRVLFNLNAVVGAANAHYDFDINAITAAQLARYRSGQFYSWHMDYGGGAQSLRKLSIVVELQPAKEGGGLEIFDPDGQPIELGVGDAVVFPSFVMHRAKPVTDGERWSLTAWVLGDEPWK